MQNIDNISLSTGLLGWSHEDDQIGRLKLFRKEWEGIRRGVGGPVGIEFNLAEVGWAPELFRAISSGYLGWLREITNEGGVLSVHTPNELFDEVYGTSLQRKEMGWIARVGDKVPINHVVVHADRLGPGQHADFSYRYGRSHQVQIVFENTDGRKGDGAVRTKAQLRELVNGGSRLLLDLGHVDHAGASIRGELPDILDEFKQAIVAYHISGVVGEDGEHLPLTDPRSRGVLALLREHGSLMNGGVRVIESPKPRESRLSLAEFAIREVKYLR